MINRQLHLIPSIVAYVLAGLLAAYTVWSWIYSADVITQARAAGQLASGALSYEVVNFYMVNCGQFLVYACLLAGAGLLLQRQAASHTAPAPPQPDAADERAGGQDDGELDEWFEADEATEPFAPKPA
jgi:hypothetical protein